MISYGGRCFAPRIPLRWRVAPRAPVDASPAVPLQPELQAQREQEGALPGQQVTELGSDCQCRAWAVAIRRTPLCVTSLLTGDRVTGVPAVHPLQSHFCMQRALWFGISEVESNWHRCQLCESCQRSHLWLANSGLLLALCRL